MNHKKPKICNASLTIDFPAELEESWVALEQAVRAQRGQDEAYARLMAEKVCRLAVRTSTTREYMHHLRCTFDLPKSRSKWDRSLSIFHGLLEDMCYALLILQ